MREAGSREPPIDCTSDVAETVADLEETFGVTDEQPSVGPQDVGESVEQSALGRFVEIDDDIAAEDHVKCAAHRPGVEKVQLIEHDQRFEGLRHLDRVVIDLRDELMAQRSRDRFGALAVVAAGLRGRDHVRIDIGRQDLRIPALAIAERFANGHRDRIGLLAGGAARRPDPEAANRRRPRLRKIGQHLAGEELEVMRLAEKARQVRGDGIDHHPTFRLALRAFQDLAVVGEILDAERPKSAGQPTVDEVALALAQDDSRLLLDQPDDCREVAVEELEFLLCRDWHGRRLAAAHRRRLADVDR